MRANLSDALVAALSRKPDVPTGLLLSGGFDSACAAAALRRAGRKPVVIYGIAFGKYENQDNRIALLRAASLFPGVEFRVLHTDREVAKERARKIIRRNGSVLKTSIENCLVTEDVVAACVSDGVRSLVNGMGGDERWGTSRQCGMARGIGGDIGFREMRLFCCAWPHIWWPASSQRMWATLCADAGVGWEDPFEDIDVVELMLRLTYQELHPSGIKSLALVEFPEIAFPRPWKCGMQTSTGALEYMELVSVEAGFSSAVAMYGAMAREDGIPPRGNPSSKTSWDATVDLKMVDAYVRLDATFMRERLVRTRMEGYEAAAKKAREVQRGRS